MYYEHKSFDRENLPVASSLCESNYVLRCCLIIFLYPYWQQEFYDLKCESSIYIYITFRY